MDHDQIRRALERTRIPMETFNHIVEQAEVDLTTPILVGCLQANRLSRDQIEGKTLDDIGLSLWEKREGLRFYYGIYEPIIINRFGVNLAKAIPTNSYFLHHAKQASDEATNQVAYTRNQEDALRDMHVRSKLGKFLNKFQLPQEDIKEIANAFSVLLEPYTMTFTQEPLIIERVYRNSVHSCMSHDRGYYNPQMWLSVDNVPEWAETEEKAHPVWVYGNEDVGLVYLTNTKTNSIVSRTLVNLKDETYVRLYGIEKDNDVLLDMMCKQWPNMQAGNLHGCKLNRIDLTDHRVAVPYIDGNSSSVEVHNDYLLVSSGENQPRVYARPHYQSGQIPLENCSQCNTELNADTVSSSRPRFDEVTYDAVRRAFPGAAHLWKYHQDSEEYELLNARSYFLHNHSFTRMLCDSCVEAGRDQPPVNVPALEDRYIYIIGNPNFHDNSRSLAIVDADDQVYLQDIGFVEVPNFDVYSYPSRSNAITVFAREESMWSERNLEGAIVQCDHGGYTYLQYANRTLYVEETEDGQRYPAVCWTNWRRQSYGAPEDVRAISIFHANNLSETLGAEGTRPNMVRNPDAFIQAGWIKYCPVYGYYVYADYAVRAVYTKRGARTWVHKDEAVVDRATGEVYTRNYLFRNFLTRRAGSDVHRIDGMTAVSIINKRFDTPEDAYLKRPEEITQGEQEEELEEHV